MHIICLHRPNLLIQNLHFLCGNWADQSSWKVDNNNKMKWNWKISTWSPSSWYVCLLHDRPFLVISSFTEMSSSDITIQLEESSYSCRAAVCTNDNDSSLCFFPKHTNHEKRSQVGKWYCAVQVWPLTQLSFFGLEWESPERRVRDLSLFKHEKQTLRNWTSGQTLS